MAFAVFLTEGAARDLEDIYEYIALHDGAGKADHLLSRIEKVFAGLVDTPERGAFPHELLELGIREFRELRFKPYRIIYRVLNNRVYVLLVADGRRDMQSLLLRRLIES